MSLLKDNEGIVNKLCYYYTNNNEDFKDMKQSIIAQAWKSFPGFRNESKFSTWLHVIARNTVVSIARKTRKYKQVIPFQTIQVDFIEEDFDERIWNEINYIKLQKSIHILPESDKDIIQLYLHGVPGDKIGEIVRMKGNAVRVRIDRIKKRLRKHVKTKSYEKLLH